MRPWPKSCRYTTKLPLTVPPNFTAVRREAQLSSSTSVYPAYFIRNCAIRKNEWAARARLIPLPRQGANTPMLTGTPAATATLGSHLRAGADLRQPRAEIRDGKHHAYGL